MDNIFDHIYRNIKEIENSLSGIVVKAAEAHKEELADLNVDQIERGLSPDGDFIGEYQSDDYALLKQALGSRAPLGKVDLKLEGDFISKLKVERKADMLLFDSTDHKTDKLESKYGTENIFGLTEESVNKLPDTGIIEQIQEEILNGLTNR